MAPDRMFLTIFSLVMGALVQAISADYVDYADLARSYKFFADIKTWHEARVACRKDGAELAMPLTVAEADVLKAIFDEHPMATIAGHKPNRMLLNFHDLFQQGEFVLESGDTIQYAYHNWSRGEPKMDHERCGSMDRAGAIDDFPCEEKAAYVCQKGNGLYPETPDAKCSKYDAKYVQFGGKCYKYHIEPKVWPEARAICHAEGGYLAIIRSKREEDFLLGVMNKPENAVTHVPRKCCAHIGFHDRFSEGYYVTVSGKTLEEVGYINWHRGNPDNSAGKEDCGSLHKSGGFNDIYCYTPAPFICERFLSDGLDERWDILA